MGTLDSPDLAALFPAMPPEVRDWFDERVRSLGWPPVSPEWFGVLRGLSVNEWRSLRWERRTINLRSEPLTHDTQQIIRGVIDANLRGVENEFSVIDCSREKLQELIRYAGETHALPGELIFLEAGPALDVVDGCHRMALFFAMEDLGIPGGTLNPECAAWVGHRRP